MSKPLDPRAVLGNLTLANQLTFLRLVAVPVFILSIVNARFDWALWIFIGASVTDVLDGLIARVFRQRTALGAYLDPVADKLLMTASFVLLTEYPQMFRDIPMVARIPIWLTIFTISRDVIIIVVSILLYVANGQTRFHPTVWGKLTTLSEMLTIGFFLLYNDLGRTHGVLDMVVVITLVLTFVSGLHYLFRTVRQERAESPESGTPAP